LRLVGVKVKARNRAYLREIKANLLAPGLLRKGRPAFNAVKGDSGI